MDEYVNRQCKVIWILFGHPRSYKKKENWTCLHLAQCQQWHQTENDKDKSATEPPQPPKKKHWWK